MVGSTVGAFSSVDFRYVFFFFVGEARSMSCVLGMIGDDGMQRGGNELGRVSIDDPNLQARVTYLPWLDMVGSSDSGE